MPKSSSFAPALYRDAQALDVAALDRGLEFGDGLFETLRIAQGRLVDWPAHYERLALGAARLGLTCPPLAQWAPYLPPNLSAIDEGVCKFILTRGQGGTGYSPRAHAPSRVYTLVTPPRRGPEIADYTVGVLSTPMMLHPILAGLKTLNRLDSVLARLELQQHPHWHDGLMTDGKGHVLCASLGNVFFQINGHWITPSVEEGGIAGCVRRRLIEHWPSDFGRLQQRAIRLEELALVQSAFVTNSLIGVQPIHCLGSTRLGHAEAPSVLRDLLNRLWGL